MSNNIASPDEFEDLYAPQTDKTVPLDAWNKLLFHLMRGGSYGHYWVSDKKKKYTVWWKADSPAPIPTEGDVYFGVNPVTHIPPENASGEPALPEHVRSRINIIEAANCLYAEFDAKDVEGGIKEVLEYVSYLTPEPSVVIPSGGGAHCYWFFDKPFIIDSEEKRRALKHYQHEWVAHVGGDLNVRDITRILRVPGTFNQKYDPPRPVTILEYNDLTYSIDELTALLPPIPPEAPIIEYEWAENDGLKDGDYWLNKYLHQNDSRNQRGLKLAQQLHDNNFSRTEAEAILLKFASLVRNERKSGPYTTGEAMRAIRWAWNKPKRAPSGLPPGGLAKAVGAENQQYGKAELIPDEKEGRILPFPKATSSLEVGRSIIDLAIDDYLSTPSPDHILLIKAPPGVGKTHLSSKKLQEILKGTKHRALFVAQRHDMFQQLAQMPHFDPDMWYEWLPHKQGNPETNERGTCHHAEYFNLWASKGHETYKFCENVCGAAYRDRECAYHAQTRVKHQIIFAQHAHPFLSLPIKNFKILIGDENPISAVLHERIIPASEVCPSYRTFAPEPHWILKKLKNIVETGAHYEGVELLKELGDAHAVLEAAKQLTISEIEKIKESPQINQADEAKEVYQNFFWELIKLLKREAEFAVKGKPYLNRVIVHESKLILLLRRSLSDEMPQHIIWLDATGQKHIYETVFERPVEVVEPKVSRVGRVIQVVNRANGKGYFLDKEGNPTRDSEQACKLVEKIIENEGYNRNNIGVFTYKDAKKLFPHYKTGHFGAETGSNTFEGVDALFVIGTPLPEKEEIKKIARMLFHKRMEPFDDTWEKPERMGMHGKITKASGYRYEPDLQAIVEQVREAKILQAAERARANVHHCDIWLLTNIPIPGYPPDKEITIRDILGAPRDVDMWNWEQVLQTAIALCDEREEEGFSCSELQAALDVSENTAEKYFNLLINQGGFEIKKIGRSGGRGRPPRKIGRD